MSLIENEVENWLRENLERTVADNSKLKLEFARLSDSIRHGSANRYWEGRWRDEAAENARLRSFRDAVWPYLKTLREAGAVDELLMKMRSYKPLPELIDLWKDLK